MFTPDVVIRHSPCDDGSIASMIVYKYYKEVAKLEQMPEFVEGNYSNKSTDYWIEKVRGKKVLVVDFSFKGPIRKAMETACESMLLLDHHASAKQEYGNEALAFVDGDGNIAYTISDADALLEENKIVMLMADNHCGSSVAWDFFFPEDERPDLLDYIEDQDLGRRKLENATAFTYWLRGRQDYHNPKNYSFLNVFEDAEEYDRAMHDGNTVYKFVEHNLKLAANWAAKGPVTIEGEEREFKIAIALAPYQFASELANIMLDVHEIDASLVFYSGENMGTGVSIRGAKSEAGLNTNYARKIAESLGGGGHDAAAGANWSSYLEMCKLVAEITEDWGKKDG